MGIALEQIIDKAAHGHHASHAQCMELYAASADYLDQLSKADLQCFWYSPEAAS